MRNERRIGSSCPLLLWSEVRNASPSTHDDVSHDASFTTSRILLVCPRTFLVMPLTFRAATRRASGTPRKAGFPFLRWSG